MNGNIALLKKPLISIVGARNASAAACRFARQLAYALGEQDVVVVSGLARGIDSSAHDGAMEAGTIGVVAGGIDIFYPPENKGRQEAMFERGIVVAEMPPGTEPRARHFPHRNRIIAGFISEPSSSKLHLDRDHSLPRGLRVKQAGKSWRCPARRSIRGPRLQPTHPAGRDLSAEC